MTTLTQQEAVEKADVAYAAASTRYNTDGRETYRQRTSAAEEVLAADLATIYPTTVPELIWRRVWEDHHSEGYSMTAQAYEELAAIVQVAEDRVAGRVASS